MSHYFAILAVNDCGNNMSSDCFSHVWGPMNPDIIFYLPTPPALPAHWCAYDANAITQLVDLNGNHWRKIVTIMAKICCLEPDINIEKGIHWKLIRDQLFSQPNDTQTKDKHRDPARRLRCQLRIVNPNIDENKNQAFSSQCWHILCGKEVQHRMGILDASQYIALDQQQKILHQQTVLLTPYLDYRQYSNALIELTRQQMPSHQ